MSSKNPEKILCRTPAPGKAGTRIDRWKFDLIREAILALLPASQDGLPAMDLPVLLTEYLEERLSGDELARLGSITWYTVCVKLEMEVRGELERVPKARPQRIRAK